MSEIKSARRVFEILELFDRLRRPLALGEVTAALRYPASSGSALLKSMVALGYLEHDHASRTYFPTMRIAALGSWVQDALVGDLAPLMQSLRRATGETVILATESDLFAQYIHLVHAEQPLQFAVQPGTRRPLAQSGMGWLFLSAHTPDEIEKLRRRINAAQRSKITREELLRRTTAVRAQGYAFSKGAVSRGAGIIAMLLPTPRHGRRLALGVAGSLARLEPNEEKIVRALRRVIARAA
ncbi:MAG TPA: helix-turn-helix domain-containing protein [Rhizomicrobium sp.]|jgi:DNA-binding IclR family transcriptional regulator|nr:helix-turn-helix domain-containing protein [Rhizomicrobium sp.]